ncbi:hypothetical protein LTR17_011433 [Elasticomyces elasticus]|nr:hypothetical protein LTR17_011433 [Elasticomyces elasticus]
MAHDKSQPHRVQLKQTLETKREREFYRYYEPIQSLTETGPPLCDLHNADSVKAHRPLSSPDRALTAFCQLGALRLGCRRAMLFFFDRNYAYVLAEATRTLSLQDDSVHEAEDSLWLGPGDPTDDPISHIINDLDEDTQFCGKPYVTDGPKAKFYAGVPITTDKGVNIGAYCCLDDRKRVDGLDANGIIFLQDMAKTVMTHLEMVRAKAEQDRSTRMVKSLGAFVEGAASMQSWEKETCRRDYRRVGSRAGSPSTRPTMEPVASTTTTNGGHRVTMQSSAAMSSSSTATRKSSSDSRSGSPVDTATPDVSRIHRQTTENVQDLSEQLIPPNVQDVFQRAADLLREAVGVDGVAFLDGSPNTFGGLVDSHGSGQSSDTFSSATEHTGGESDSRPSSRIDRGAEKACKVLASSHSPEDKYDSSGELQHDIQATTITERFLRSLLKRYPHGKIWNFSEDLSDTSSDDSAPEVTARPNGHDHPRVSNTKFNVDDHVARRAARRQGRIDDGREIRRLFPGVRSLALCGMWDQNRGRWFSGCAIWSYAPLRLLSDSEVNYMSAFCDVVMAEIYRLEAQNSDRMKADFISSISHELRSPLHGILGSVECLQELSFADSFHSDLVSQIEVCGRTLLDIVEHLLDYKKMNHVPKTKGPPGDAKLSPTKRPTLSDTRKSSMGAMMSLESQVWLDEVTEETVSSAVYSFCCARSKENILNRRVTVILDIDRTEPIDWQCKIALGAWKRICINLVSNALKYTSEGYIRISLKAVPIPGKRKRFNAVFTVQDSGRGMSREFLTNHFFKPFSQEDVLMEGTGLGMSLVAKIVRAMSGKVDVQSEKGCGTTMTVVVPVDVGRPSKARKSLSAGAEALGGCSVGILGFGDARAGVEATNATRHELARTKLLQSIRLGCEQLGLDVRQTTDDVLPEADVYIIAEADLSIYAQSKQLNTVGGTRSGLEKPLVIVCNSAISVRQLRASSAAAGFSTEHLEYTAQPLGTISLGKAIRNCLPSLSNAPGHSITREDTTVGAASARLTERSRPHEHNGIHERTGRLPSRTRTSHSSSSSEQDQAPRSLVTNPLKPRQVQGGADRSVLDQPNKATDDYLSNRSRSTGDRPLTPRAVEQTLPEKNPVVSSTKHAAPPSGLSLLLVDDNQINLQLLVNYARKQGHRKATASDGQQAVDAYKAACLASGLVHSTALAPSTTEAAAGKDGTETLNTLSEKPQVILMDISMPVLNGFEATRLIRAFELQNGLVPAHIIALTGLGSADAQQEAFSSGVDLFLTKPVRLKELTKLLDGIKNGDHTRADTPVPK